MSREKLEKGDSVLTTALNGKSLEKIQAEIDKIDGKSAIVLYGKKREKAVVPLSTCTFAGCAQTSKQ